MIVGTAGHIDHGKTSLVRALTGVDTDRLKEEKARGISIDLGFAYMPAPDGSIIGFVDVPGHEKFIHNMLAGATGIDFVMLVVAADDGVMPQTREHLAIIDLLGITRGIVVLSKIDLVSSERQAEIVAQISDTLAGTGLTGADIVPVSTKRIRRNCRTSRAAFSRSQAKCRTQGRRIISARRRSFIYTRRYWYGRYRDGTLRSGRRRRSCCHQSVRIVCPCTLDTCARSCDGRRRCWRKVRVELGRRRHFERCDRARRFCT